MVKKRGVFTNWGGAIALLIAALILIPAVCYCLCYAALEKEKEIRYYLVTTLTSATLCEEG